ncbi:MAG: class I SAM-dependent methyltransferase [Verrucomicrobiales bacterium]|nr:class I SAM-dependent methyltransferase [Verrucomicrobiales bacterium]
MSDPFPKESESLRNSWDRHPADILDSYLVSTTEDPRINPQSILDRALIADTLWPGKFDALIDEELQFAATLSWVMRELENGAPRGNLLGHYEKHFPDIDLSDQIIHTLSSRTPHDSDDPFTHAALSPYQSLWHHALKSLPDTTPISVVEPACGSANDYRFLHDFGFARFLDYTGFDIANKNIDNANARFPDVPFHVANAYDTPFADNQFDFLFVHDLYEHLSPAALETALAETSRITARQAWLHFFNLEDRDDHHINSVEEYHWNTLSLEKTVNTLQSHGATDIDLVHIPSFIAEKIPHHTYHNEQATTLIVTFE